MATQYPYTQSANLVNSVTTNTVVSLNGGMQVAQVSFSNPSGLLGQITLSPVQPTANNVEFKRGNQVVFIETISFRAAFGFDSGQVTCNGEATDQDGKNQTPFNAQIASWSN